MRVNWRLNRARNLCESLAGRARYRCRRLRPAYPDGAGLPKKGLRRPTGHHRGNRVIS